MKFFIVFALCVAAASARFIIPDAAAAEAIEIKEILAAINNPSTDPATAAALLQLLNDILGIGDSHESDLEESPIAPSPVIVEENEDSPIAPGPVIVDENEDSPIAPGPAIINESDFVDEQSPSSSPLVQIIINVNPGASIVENPVEVLEPSPVIVVDNEDIEVAEKPIIDTPVFPSPAVVPDDLN